jgi:MFS transporter, YNFM family, putative membrane transport protein
VLHSRFAMPLSRGGAMLAVFGLGGLLFSRSAGALLRHIGPPAQARIGSALLAAGFALLAWMPHWGLVTVGCALGGFGFYALHNTIQVNATQLSTTSRGLAVSLFACSLFLGQSAGVAAAALVFARGEPAWGFGIAGMALTAVGLGFAHQLRKRESPVAPV